MGVTASDPRHGNRTKDRAEPLAGPAGAERLPFDSLAQRRPPGSQEPGRAGRAGRASRVLAIGLAAGLVGGAGGAAALATGAGLWDRTTSPGTAVTPAPGAAGAAGTAGTPGVPALLKKVLPGVVSIETSLASGQRGAGTGVIVSTGGDVLTNAHVVNGATSISVTRYGTNSPLKAQLVGATPSEDLALVHIPGASGLPAATLGTSGNVPVGTSVVAVGNALGLSAGTPTATVGIISAEGRSVTTEAHGQNVTLTGLFQTDAAINPGNSGGPLFDQSGKVVAINTAVAGSAEGIGFAIPIDKAKALLGDLRHGGTSGAPAAFIGVEAVTLTPALRDAYGLVASSGALVVRVVPGSPAGTAGLRPGDVVTAADGKPIEDAAQLHSAAAAAKPGDRVQLQVVRGSTTTTLGLVLSAAPLGS